MKVAEWLTTTGVGVDALNEPFWLKAASYDAPGTRLDITIGPGRADFSNPGGVMRTTQAADTHVYIATPAISTTYYIFLVPANGAASYRTSTVATPAAGEACLGSVTTGNPIGSAVTRTDLRGNLPVPSSSLTTTATDIKPLNPTAVLGASALGAPSDHQHGVPVATVTGLSADLVDGLHASNASGAVPISNGTLNTNLNADMVDGYHAGHATGTVAISDGTLVTNLNADMTDGIHAAAGTVGGVLAIGANKGGTIEPRTLFTANSRPTSDTGVLTGDILFNG